MKVAIDVSPLKSGHQFRGIGFYTQNLVAGLESLPQKNFQLELVKNGKIPEDADLVHYPFFDLFKPTLPIQKNRQAVVTVHDVIPLLFPKQYPPGIRGQLKLRSQKRSLAKVSAVICDSRASKNDIINYLGYPKEKIKVIYLAASKIYQPIKDTKILDRILSKYKLPKRFVLYVGDVNYHKNLLGLVKACQEIKVPLVIVGQRAGLKTFSSDHIEEQPLVQLIKLHGENPEVIRLGFVPIEDQVAIYNLAAVYCQPSLYEGFGLPVLEAMACGTPVVCARTGSLPEVGGQAVLMVDPRKSPSLSSGLKKVLFRPQLKKSLVKAGFKQAKKFSWTKTARETLAVYRQVCEKS